MKLMMGDCLDRMREISDGSVDAVITDLPYGTTACKWDVVIPFDKLWEQLERVIRNNGVFVMFSTQPFTTTLIASNIENYRYSWIWKKESPTGFLNANYAPLKIYEDICIFSKNTVGSLSKKPIRFFPQGTVVVNRKKKNRPSSRFRLNQGYPALGNKLNSEAEYVQKLSHYPTNILSYSRDAERLHPTQKPVALIEYLIRTYTNEGETVLDATMGSGTAGVACVNTNRNFIGIEKERKYFEIAERRIGQARATPRQELMAI